MQSVNSISERNITTTGIFNYSQELVFNAWADPKLLAQWWGPKGFTNTFHVFDFKPGGWWKFTMHGPHGNDYINENKFTEIIPSEKIVFEHIEPIHLFKATAVFEKKEDMTRLSFHMQFESEDEFEKVKEFIAIGNVENFERLETVLTNNK